ncbi:MAG: ATP-dependent helicase, partial [Fibrobacteria bacterium]
MRAGKGAALALALSGGTIPDRGLYTLRHAESRSRIGELDEEFVWERREGDLFALGSQSWRIVNIIANEVEVVQADRPAQMAPFWRAEERDRGLHLSARVGEFLETADGRLGDPGLARELIEEHGLEAPGAEALLGYLRRQREATGTSLPHRHHLLIEEAGLAPGGSSGPGKFRGGGKGKSKHKDDGNSGGAGDRLIVLHAIWGGRLNRPWAYAMAAAFEERHGLPLEIISGDDCLLATLPEGIEPGSLIDLVNADTLESLIRKRLEHTGWFAAHFRENAARALLLPRSTARSRVPLWLNRIRSRNLLQAVSALPDFPIVLETWRECLRDEFDLPALKARLEEIQSGVIRIGEARTGRPSPFAESLIWKQTNSSMYEHDKPAETSGGSGDGAGRGDLLREIAFSAPLRPRIPRVVIADFEAKSLRLAPGYAPQDAGELVEWVKERVLIPWNEWLALLPRCGIPQAQAEKPEKPEKPIKTGAEDALRAAYLDRLGSRLLGVKLPGADINFVAPVESLPRLLASLRIDSGDVVFSHALEGMGYGGAVAPEAALRHLERLTATGLANIQPDSAGLDFDPGADLGGEHSIPNPAPAIAQWLRAFGPVPLALPRGIFGNAFAIVEEAVGELVDGDGAVHDVLSEDAVGPELCDAGNLEILLRLMRRRARPEFRTLPAERLPLFLAAWQGVAEPSRDAQGLQTVMEKLFGYPAQAAAWETDILPARSVQYLPSRLDELFRDSDLAWTGRGKERIAFAFPEDLDLFPTAADDAPLPPDPQLVSGILDEAVPGRLDFQALAARCPLPSDRIADALWDLVWRGRITNDTYAVLRKGIEAGFKAA